MNSFGSLTALAPLALVAGFIAASVNGDAPPVDAPSQVEIASSEALPAVVDNSFAEIVLEGVVSGVDAECRPSTLLVTIGERSAEIALDYGQTLDGVALALLDALYEAGFSAVTVPGPVVIVNISGDEHGVRALSSDRTLNTTTGAFRF